MDIAESIIIFVLCFVIVVIPTAFLFIRSRFCPSPQGRLVDKYDRLLSYLIVNQYDNSKET